MTLIGRTLEEMRSEAITLACLYLVDAKNSRDRGRVHASLMRKAAAQRKRAEFLTYCIRHRNESR